ncbi:MAG: HNH endonuclease [Pseudomonadota bacterium]
MIDFKALSAPFPPEEVSWRLGSTSKEKMRGMALDKTRGWSIPAKLSHRSIPEPNSGCLLWLAAVNASGYGIIGINGRSLLAHRVAWEAEYGPIPDGLHALHKCDVRSCINVYHLFLGTNADNVADKCAKGRAIGEGPTGEDHPSAKLTEDDIRAIRLSVLGPTALGRQCGVSQSLISMIRARKRWAHVEDIHD